MSAHDESRPSTCTNPRPALTSSVNSSRPKGKRKTPTTTLANTMPAPKRCCRTDSLTRNDLQDIGDAILVALPNATATTSAHSSFLATQSATNPPSQPITPEEEWQHQEIG